jgi:(1->4)-alpha-D-glucan 1-alpha-D-glucosylmutase
MALRATPDLVVSDNAGLSECLDRLAAEKRYNRPGALYRLQFHAGFRFEDARRLVPYLHALGVTHCYASPILKARAQSKHGYDIIDHNEVNPEIGTEEEFRALVRELRARQMGLVLDIVPNHMGVGYGGNPWWQDVLENGRASEYAEFFDIDWEPVKAELRNKLLIPILGDAYGEELEQGRIRLNQENGRFFLTYYDKVLPVDPQTIPMIFETLGDLRTQAPEITPSDAERSELENVLFNLRQLPRHDVAEAELAQRRRREIPELKQRLRELLERSGKVRALVAEAVRRANGEPGNARSFDALHRLLEAQAYRLAYWRVSAHEINYRRFFDINDLIGLRMENPQVFAATHRLLRRLLAEGSISGLRLDHPDGLLNPVQYFTRLQMLYAASQCSGPDPQPPLADNGIEIPVQEIFAQHDWIHEQAPLYVLVEKILEPGEELPQNWPVDGTVGYDFLRLVNGIFIDKRSERAFSNIYRRFIGGPVDLETLIYESKKKIMLSALSSEVTVLSHMLEEISSTDRRARDFTRPLLTDAIREAIACFPVYRTYIDERGNVSERDRMYIEVAVGRAKRRNPATSGLLFNWLRDILLLQTREFAGPEWHRQRLRFTLKFQQLTGPVMAKGLEDTVCYVYNRLVSLNDVGCTPAEFGITVDEFHRGNRERLKRWPFSLLTTSTHDTKRSEDVRARINVLSEMPKLWSAQVMRWRRLNRGRKKALGDGRVVPDFNEEYLLYQVLVGAWPLELGSKSDREHFLSRIRQYMNKAVHEAKVNLSWVNQDPEYVAALEAFVTRILQPGTASRPNLFLQDLERFVPAVAFFGAMNSLSQTLLKITAPGVADMYQGTELWDFSLVDPDNRREVDFELRRRRLEELSHRANEGESSLLPRLCEELLENWRDGRIKLWTTLRALNFRRARAPLFRSGSYLPLPGAVEKEEHIVAFAREYKGSAVVAAVPRLSYELMSGQMRPPIADAWGNAELVLPPGYTEFVNVFTGEMLASSNGRTLLGREVFAHFPVALLAAR